MRQVADLLECSPVTVRKAVHRYTGGGCDALADAPRPGWPAQVTCDGLDALGALLDASAEAGVTWTAPELCNWWEKERGMRVSAAWLTELLHRQGFRWKRTRDSLRHKADPVLQQSARDQLEHLRMEADTGARDLIFLDESGFAPTMPTGYTWSRVGQRAVVPREDTRGRRVNVLGALLVGTAPDLLWERTSGKTDAAMLLEFVCCRLARLPGWPAALSLAADGAAVPGCRRSRPCTAVLDNASAHVAKEFKGRRAQLAKIGGGAVLPAAPQSGAQ